MQILHAENLTGPVAHHGEGPVWSQSWGGLRWVDMLSGTLLTLRSDRIHRLSIDDPIAAFVRPRNGGGYVVGTEQGIALSDHPDAPPTQRIPLWDDPAVRMNDGTTTPEGRLLAGTMPYDGTAGAGSLFAVEPDLRASVELADVTVSNGIGFSPAGDLVYYVDTRTKQIQRFEYRDRRLRSPRVFAEFDAGQGVPDGLTVAADGSVWVALWGGSAVHGYSPHGELTTVVEVPVTQVSACTFGGPGLETLFITTSRQNLAEHDQPEAGSVFYVRPGPVGLPVINFQG